MNDQKYMYVVYLEKRDNTKETLFVTGVLQTATSFLYNFNTELYELQKEYMQEKYTKNKFTNKYYDWVSRVKDFTDRINMHITKEKSLSDMLSELEYFYSIDYEKVKFL